MSLELFEGGGFLSRRHGERIPLALFATAMATLWKPLIPVMISRYLHLLILAALFFPTLHFAASGASATPVKVSIDSTRTYQTIKGFGTCLIAWQSDFRELYRTEEFQRIYAEDLGMTMLRANLRGRTLTEPVEDWKEIRWQDLDFDERAAIFVEFGRALRENHHPDLKIIGSVWSGPDWMKINKHKNDTRSAAIRAHDYGGIDNRVDPKYFMHFARWVVEMVKYYDHHGAPLYALSIANEPQFTQTFESSVWSGDHYAEVLAMVGRMLEEEGYGHVKLFGPETMTSHFYEGGTGDYLHAVMAHEEAARYLDVFATHGYEDGVRAEMDAENMVRARELARQHDLPFWITEGGTGGHDWPEPLHNGVATMYHNALVAGNVEAIVPWQVTGSQRSTHELMYRDRFTPKTYAAWHFSHFIRPGAIRIHADPSAYGDVAVSAFVHTARNETVIVGINASDTERNLEFNLTGINNIESFRVVKTSGRKQGEELERIPLDAGTMNLLIPAQSIVTLVGTSRK